MASKEESTGVATLANRKITYVVRAQAKARPVHILHSKFGRVAIGGPVTIDKPLKGTFSYREVTSQKELEYFYKEEGLTHLIDAVEG